MHPRSGSFAEIGAGQEVSHWFSTCGGGRLRWSPTWHTTRKSATISTLALDRATSSSDWRAMLDKEWSQLLAQLSATRGSHTRYAPLLIPSPRFAGTNGKKTATGSVSGFVTRQAACKRRLQHINMRDPLQCPATGSRRHLGVNQLHAAFNQVQTKETFLAGFGGRRRQGTDQDRLT